MQYASLTRAFANPIHIIECEEDLKVDSMLGDCWGEVNVIYCLQYWTLSGIMLSIVYIN
jgi:hypothetical protein